MNGQKNNNNSKFAVVDALRYGLYVISALILYPWYQRLNDLNLLYGGLKGVEKSTTDMLLYMFMFYPIFFLLTLIFSMWLASRHSKYLATAVNLLPPIYMMIVFIMAQQAKAQTTAAHKKEVIEAIGKLPIPGKGVGKDVGEAIKGIFKGFGAK